ncbi:MAG: hypothetical protein V7754_19610, partial [Halioglobus sp.]
MKNMGKTNLISLAILLSGIPVANVASAQAVLEEVFVTAQKREQSLQDVPASVSVITGDSM